MKKLIFVIILFSLVISFIIIIIYHRFSFDSFDSLSNWNLEAYPLNGCDIYRSQVSCSKSLLNVSLDIDSVCTNKYKGGEITSILPYKYGLFTIRLKNQIVPGSSSSFFLINKWTPGKWKEKRIGIYFSGNDTRKVHFVVQLNHLNGKNNYYQYIHELEFNSADTFHNYSVLWSKDSISWLVDSKWVYTERRAAINEELYLKIHQWTNDNSRQEAVRAGIGLFGVETLLSQVQVDFVACQLSLASIIKLFFRFITGVSLKSWDLSYFLFFISFICILLFILISKGKVWMFNIAFLFLCLGATEKYLSPPVIHFSSERIIKSPGAFLSSNIFGYKPEKNFTDHFRKYYNDTLIYNVKITTDENGLRKTPSITPNANTKSIVFFGCSFTWGDGLEDNEVLPNIVQEAVKDTFKVYNFGVTGYGTHQMLAAIEHHMIDSIVKFEPQLFIYTALPEHIDRILNLKPWTGHDPKYVLDTRTNEPVCLGNFDAIKPNFIENILMHSEIIKRFKKKEATAADVKLITAIVIKSKKLLLSKYPNSKFEVMLWDFPGKFTEMIINELKNNKISVHTIGEILPELISNQKDYVIYYPYEKHPNFKANQLVSNYIVNNIIHKKSFTDQFDTLSKWDKQKFSIGECGIDESQVSCAYSKLILNFGLNSDGKNKFKGGEIISRSSYKSGLFTIRLKNNISPSSECTFSLMSKWQPVNWERKEIAICFVGNDLTRVMFTVADEDGKNKKFRYQHTHNLGFNSADAYHNYSILWNNDSISWLIDNKWVYSEKHLTIEEDEKMYMHIIHWGASQQGPGEKFAWMLPQKEMKLPSKVDVDFVTYNQF